MTELVTWSASTSAISSRPPHGLRRRLSTPCWKPGTPATSPATPSSSGTATRSASCPRLPGTTSGRYRQSSCQVCKEIRVVSSSSSSSSSSRCSSSSRHSGFADGSTLPPTRTLPIPLSQDEALLQALCVGHPFIGGASDDTSGEGSGISAVPERPWIKGKGEAEACRARLNRIEEEAHSEVGCWRVLLTRGGGCGTGTKAVGIGIAEYFEV